MSAIESSDSSNRRFGARSTGRSGSAGADLAMPASPVGGPGLVHVERIEVIPLRVPLRRVFSGSNYSMNDRCTLVTRVWCQEGIVGESYPDRDPIFWALNTARTGPKNGLYELSEAPGLGLSLDEDFIQRWREDR